MSEDAGPSTNYLPDKTTIPQRYNVVKSYGISIDSSKIHEVALEERPEHLRALGVNIFDQDVFEDGVLQQVDEAIAAQEEILEKHKLNKELKSIEEQLRNVEQKIQKPGLEKHARELVEHDQERLKQKKNEILQRLQDFDKQTGFSKAIETEDAVSDGISKENSLDKVFNSESHEETDIERLVRLGEMTPFGGMVINHAANVGLYDGKEHYEVNNVAISSKNSFAICGQPGQKDSEAGTPRTIIGVGSTGDKNDDNDTGIIKDDHGVDRDLTFGTISLLSDIESGAGINDATVESDDDYIPDDEELKLSFMDDEHFLPEDIQHIDDVPMKTKKRKYQKEKVTKKAKRLQKSVKDDGDDRTYQIRIKEFKLKKSLREKGIDYEGKSDTEDDFWNEEGLDEEFDGGLKIPAVIWNKLFRYQKTGVKWLWELHCQQAGGIVGDEMGLGKTIQIISFLAGLKYSRIGRRSSKQEGLGAVLIVCPATVLFQWVAEFHRWWPEFRVAVLHDTGSYKGPKDTLITRIRNEPGILLTTYNGVRLNQDHLLPSRWDYVILDEGHIIRNPDADVTLTCKQFRTPHRLVLSGSPMQNNLRELWSLFDFVYPGKLGTLPVFMQEFSVPITMGGYSNATAVQVQTAYKCACVLRDTINPYLLRRLKKDVKMKLDLPNKNEQVLFCRLTEEQTELYKEYLSSRDVASILSGAMKVFPGLIMLRKICNHPDLTTAAGSLWKLRKDEALRENTPKSRDENDGGYGDWKRAGKLVVVQSLLKLWKKQKHKVLLFTQTRQMLKILEIFVKCQGYSYCRMDGSTSIASRQPLIEKFNKDESIFVFLLTTRVGGLGVNLVGANRVIIYDPDWNPGTDMQARERSWRVGQKKDVTIYRLLTTGTIEEKIYHRQIFKQFLTNRVLKDPKQRRFFKSNDLFELFTLDTTDGKESGTETSAIFAGLGCEVNVPLKSKSAKRKRALLDENVFKTIQERTKEILKTQFSTSKKQPKESCVKTHPEDKKICIDEQTEDVFVNNETVAVSGGSNTSQIIRKSSMCSRPLNDTTSEMRGDEQMPMDYTTDTKEGEVKGTEPESNNTNTPFTSKVSWNSGEGKGDSKKVRNDLVLGRNEKKKDIKKKSKKQKRNKVEGIRIGQLSHSEAYGTRNDSSDADKHSDDDYILRKLFKKSGVHSALQHDTIVDSGNADHVLVENEAKRVAAQAAEAVKRSRDQCMQLRHSGLPTWTGQFGVVGSPHGLQERTLFGPKTKIQQKEDTLTLFSGKSLLQNKEQGDMRPALGNPMSSTQLLARIRARNSVGGNSTGNDVQFSEQKYVQTMTEVRNFIATGCSLPGRATTQEILAEFSARLPISDSAIFREMLRTICEFDREPSGEGYWMLKSDFT